METRGLLFIPDISGFTRFVNETEIDHSRLIIQELLEILINANDIGLEISEIEGDAILFYRFGDPPEMEVLYHQVEKMFREFHKSLILYNHSRYCQCKACISAIHLTLKVITHFGEFTDYRVKNFNKLIGKDIIIAHQLLKNDIAHHEYWLVSKNLVRDQQPGGFTEWMEWNSSAKQTDSGEISFHYTMLSQLKNSIELDPMPAPDLSDMKQVASATREYETDIITLFHATGDFNNRSRWQDGVKAVEEINHFLPRVGMKCRCLLENGEQIIYSSSYRYHPEKIEFSETEENKKSVTCFTLEQKNATQTRLTLDYYEKKNIFNSFLLGMKKKRKIQSRMNRSLQNLVQVVKEIRLPEASGQLSV